MNATPKLQKNRFTYAQSEIYHYYAGYSDIFVKELLEKYCASYNHPIILDPWNGAGTTTLVSTMLGYDSYGFDINPVMVIVAKAKLYNFNKKTIDQVINKIITTKNRVNISHDNDPLNNWFDNSSVSAIRRLEFEIQKQFFNIDKPTMLMNIWNYIDLSFEVSFFYLVMFSIIRELTKVFKSSNPTWIKTKIDDSQKIKLSYKNLKELYFNSLLNMQENFIMTPNEVNCHISQGNSQHIALNNNSLDIIITSPPYCTRIDYAIYTQVELALLGYNKEKLNLLRNSMIGTPTIIPHTDDNNSSLTSACLEILNTIKSHDSKAASSYYYKTYYQYFITMEKSISELSRVLNTNGILFLVVQDSWFKDVHINLSDILLDLCRKHQIKEINKIDFDAKNNINQINQSSSNYKENKSYKESVLILGKE